MDPDLVEGTLLQGFAILNKPVDAFARAVAMTVLITNAELSSAGHVRLVVPTVYRTRVHRRRPR